MSLDELLTGAAHAVAELERGDLGAWTLVFEHVIDDAPEAASGALLAGLLACDANPATWRRRALRAAASIDSSAVSSIREAMCAFDPWFYRAIRRDLDATSATVLVARYLELRDHRGAADLGPIRALLSDLQTIDGLDGLRASTWLLLARRALEAVDQGTAVDAALAAEAAFGGLGQANKVRTAQRIRGAAHLRAANFADAFAVLDEAMADTGPALVVPLGDSAVQFARAAPREAALDEAATASMWAFVGSPEWVRSLGGLAEHFDKPEPRERFRSALALLVAEGDAADLELVQLGAQTRSLAKTAQAAREALAELRDPTRKLPSDGES